MRCRCLIFLVTPQQAEVLSQAVAQTRIQLVLRNPLDNGFLSEMMPQIPVPAIEFPKVPKALTVPPPEVKPPGENAVKEEKKIVPAEPPPPPAPTVEVIHGTKRIVSVVAPSSDQELKK